MSEPVDLALGILDHQLLDADERRCGKVDDLELDLSAPRPHVTAILVGARGWRGRGLLGRFAASVGGGTSARVEWSEVVKVDSAIRLRRSAGEYGLGRGDERARRLVERLPGS